MNTSKGDRLSIIIVNYNAPAAIANCLKSIDEYIRVDKEVIVVDNHSTEEYLDDLKGLYDYLEIIRLPKNTGFGHANNVGVRKASGELVLLLNSDIEIMDGAITEAAADFSRRPEKELWGFRLLWPNGLLQNSFSSEITYIDFLLSYTPLASFEKYIARIREHKYRGRVINAPLKVAIVYATAILMWRRDFLALGGFDTKYFMYYEDIDFCDRFRNCLGGAVIYHPGVSMIHKVMGSSANPGKTNWEYLKSKYRYGLGKFGILKAFIFVIMDLTLITLAELRKNLFKRWGQ